MRLHTGEPAIYGAIGEQMDALDRLGIDYEVVPGISSFQAAAAALRVELTAPEVAQTVILTRTPGRTPMPPAEDLSPPGAVAGDALHFPFHRRSSAEVAATLAEHYGPECPAALVYHASWPDQKVVRGTLADIAGRMRGGRARPRRPSSWRAMPWRGPCPMLRNFTTSRSTRSSAEGRLVKIALISLSDAGVDGGAGWRPKLGTGSEAGSVADVRNLCSTPA